ncbi:DUF4097 family beta strand repeat-containing protein [Naasia aerilata]|uniref:DUF4097 domain-containing protein n=1 Tax=Naasia aerilata TaxID=1162966 RepID=A0ABN6XHS7_9MICO|nr:DUF4097 family beta strand repeat-containing protein [Naasia aerilata]BDZ44419.1 hypothetical protein GCM10025866_03280 [Naasia aerilata]
MPTYPTPAPIDLAINLPVGAIEVIASDRTDTVVTVSPTNPDKPADVRGAEETKVAFDGQRLTITGPRPRVSWIGPNESVDLRIELPSGSRLTAESSGGWVHTAGRLGATRVKAMGGPIELDTTGDLWARAGNGNLTLGAADGAVEVTADHGQIRIGSVSGDATLKASHGNVTVGEAGGDLEAKLSYGDLEIERALASVTAKTAYGSIRVTEVTAGSVQLESGYGQISIGVREGIPAWLDLSSKAGRVRNELDGGGVPGPSERTVAVRARTQYGDISIRRAQ